MKHMKYTPTLVPCVKYPSVSIFFEEIMDLAFMANTIGNWNSYQLYLTYQHHISKPETLSFIENLNVNARILGCLNPRNRSSSDVLPTGLKNQEMIFVLCCAYYFNNKNFFNKAPNEYYLQHFFKSGVVYQHNYMISLHLLPLRFVQSKRNNNVHVFGHITFGKVVSEMHQPQQHVRQPWFWLPNSLTHVAPAVITPVGLSPTHSMIYNNVSAQVPAPLKNINSNAF